MLYYKATAGCGVGFLWGSRCAQAHRPRCSHPGSPCPSPPVAQRLRMGLVQRLYSKGPTIVQPVSSCSWPSCLIMGCGTSARVRLFRSRLAAFLQQQVKDKQDFLRVLERSVRASNTILRETPCLQVDFQVLLRHDGTIFHLDMDRCWESAKQIDEWQVPREDNNHWHDGCLDGALALVRAESGTHTAGPFRSWPLRRRAHAPFAA